VPRAIALITTVLACTANVHAKEWNVPLQTPSVEYEREGTIGKLPIRMHLAVTDVYRCTDDHLQWLVGDRYSGWYAYTKIGEHLELDGFYNSQGAGGASEHPPLEINETVGGKHSGYFSTTQDNIFHGMWKNIGDPPKALRYSLHVVSSRRLTPAEPDDSICPKGRSAEDETSQP